MLQKGFRLLPVIYVMPQKDEDLEHKFSGLEEGKKQKVTLLQAHLHPEMMRKKEGT